MVAPGATHSHTWWSQLLPWAGATVVVHIDCPLLCQATITTRPIHNHDPLIKILVINWQCLLNRERVTDFLSLFPGLGNQALGLLYGAMPLLH